MDAMTLHLKEQVGVYGSQQIVNLINSKGYEKPLKDAFEKRVYAVCVFLYHHHYTQK